MTERGSVLFNFDDAGTPARKERGGFSNMPVIRRFESLLTDSDFASAGLKIAPHPSKNTFYIYPNSELLKAADDKVISNLMTPSGCIVHYSSLWIDPSSVPGGIKTDLGPIRERLDELRAIAADEEIQFNEESASEAMSWLRIVNPRTLPAVFLVNNGNTRLLWRRGDKQLGIQFLGDQGCQFVFLGEDDQTERIFGTVRTPDLIKRINGLDLSPLLGFDSVECRSNATKTSFDTWADHTSMVM